MRRILFAAAAAISVPLQLGQASAAATPVPGYIYVRDTLSELTEGCLTQAPGGLFVGIGPPLAFPTPSGGTRSILFVSDGGSVRTVATGLNSIADCVYDIATDTLYVTDSGAEFSGAMTGDTVFAIPGDSTAVPVGGLELLAAGSIPQAFSIDLFGSEGLLVSNAAGSGNGEVYEIDLSGTTPSMSTFALGFDYTGGLKVDGTRVLVSESLDSFQSAIYEYNSAGALQDTLSGPGYDHGSIDLDLTPDGSLLLVTGSPTLASIDGDGEVTPLVPGINGNGASAFDAFGGAISVNRFSGRIDFLASTFTGADDDKGIHRLVPVDKLVSGGGNTATDCAMELYGLELVPAAPGKPARSAICTDGEACDGDGLANGSCRFPLGVCINVDDDRLADCTPSSLASIEVIAMKPASSAIDDLVFVADASLPSASTGCFFSDGIDVPVRALSSGGTRPGKGFVRLRAITGDARPKSDSDVARLVCNPAP